MRLAPMGMKFDGVSISRNPNGTYSFVGRGPIDLFLVYDDLQDAINAQKHGQGLAEKVAARHGRTLKSRVFSTEAEAREFASHVDGCKLNN